MDFKSIVIATAAAGFLFSCGAQKKTEEKGIHRTEH